MGLFDSISLKDVILGWEKDYVKLNISIKNVIVEQICKAFAFLHNQENPIIHRDIKLENILINKNGQIKICNFAVSTFTTMLTSLRSTIGNRIVGTLLYLAPEIMLHHKQATTACMGYCLHYCRNL